MEVLFWPIAVLTERPWLALVPAAVFALAYAGGNRRRGVLVAAVVWALYAAYETYMRAWSETVIAPIRVDLLLVAPVLYGVTIAGAVAWARALRDLDRRGE